MYRVQDTEYREHNIKHREYNYSKRFSALRAAFGIDSTWNIVHELDLLHAACGLLYLCILANSKEVIVHIV